jgi:hypothetical protein
MVTVQNSSMTLRKLDIAFHMQEISDWNQVVKYVDVVHACMHVYVRVCSYKPILGQGRTNPLCRIPVATKLCTVDIQEKDQQYAHFFSLIYSNKTIFYVFRTNNCSSSGGYFCTCSIQYFTMHLWGV